MSEPQGQFDPYAFAQAWYEDHPEVLDELIKNQKKVGFDPESASKNESDDEQGVLG